MTTTDNFRDRMITADAQGKLPTVNIFRMGEDQWSMLYTMCEHGGWYRGAGWMWNNMSGTIRLADSLTKRGLLDRTGQDRQSRYTVNPDVQAIWRELTSQRDAERRERWAAKEREQNIARRQGLAEKYADYALKLRYSDEHAALVQEYLSKHPLEVTV